MSGLRCRPVAVSDAPALAAIRAHHVRHGHATLDTVAPTAEETTRWIGSFGDHGPHRMVVATGLHGNGDGDDRVVGFAATMPYRSHPAFDATVEASVYLSPTVAGRGVGSALYRTLFDLLRDEPIRCVLAAIALPNDASVALHHRFGFRDVGVFEGYAVKNGAPISSLWLQRSPWRAR